MKSSLLSLIALFAFNAAAETVLGNELNLRLNDVDYEIETISFMGCANPGPDNCEPALAVKMRDGRLVTKRLARRTMHRLNMLRKNFSSSLRPIITEDRSRMALCRMLDPEHKPVLETSYTTYAEGSSYQVASVGMKAVLGYDGCMMSSVIRPENRDEYRDAIEVRRLLEILAAEALL